MRDTLAILEDYPVHLCCREVGADGNVWYFVKLRHNYFFRGGWRDGMDHGHFEDYTDYVHAKPMKGRVS